MKLNELSRLLETDKLPDSFDSSAVDGGGGEGPGGTKRKREGDELGEGEGEVPPVNDVYRSRQQKRVHTA